MKIALASARIIDRDIHYNLSQMERYMREAKENGTDLVCFGEAFLQGFNALTWQYEEDKKIAARLVCVEIFGTTRIDSLWGKIFCFGRYM